MMDRGSGQCRSHRSQGTEASEVEDVERPTEEPLPLLGYDWLHGILAVEAEEVKTETSLPPLL